jgi:hypothetical protein
MATITCQNCGCRFNAHPDVDLVKCPECRVRFHASDGKPDGCHPGDSDRPDYGG